MQFPDFDPWLLDMMEYEINQLGRRREEATDQGKKTFERGGGNSKGMYSYSIAELARMYITAEETAAEIAHEVDANSKAYKERWKAIQHRLQANEDFRTGLSRVRQEAAEQAGTPVGRSSHSQIGQHAPAQGGSGWGQGLASSSAFGGVLSLPSVFPDPLLSRASGPSAPPVSYQMSSNTLNLNQAGARQATFGAMNYGQAPPRQDFSQMDYGQLPFSQGLSQATFGMPTQTQGYLGQANAGQTSVERASSTVTHPRSSNRNQKGYRQTPYAQSKPGSDPLHHHGTTGPLRRMNYNKPYGSEDAFRQAQDRQARFSQGSLQPTPIQANPRQPYLSRANPGPTATALTSVPPAVAAQAGLGQTGTAHRPGHVSQRQQPHSSVLAGRVQKGKLKDQKSERR